MKLYYSKGACSLAVRIILHELNLPFDAESVDLKSKKTAKGQDFLAVNPKGSVPALVLDNGQVLTENAVIQQYLAEQYHGQALLPPTSEFARYPILSWLNYVGSDVHKAFGPLFSPNIPENLKQELFIPNVLQKLAYIEGQIREPYLTGKNFTLPDSYLFVILRWLSYFKITLDQYPKLAAYFAMLQKRETVRKALEEEGLLPH